MSSSAVLDELVAPREAVRVLLVEDNPGDRRLVAEMLREGRDETVLTAFGRLAEADSTIVNAAASAIRFCMECPLRVRGLRGASCRPARANASPSRG